MSSPGDGSSRPVQSFDVRLIVDRIPAFTWSAHADGFVEFVNQRWREYAGLSPEESQGWGVVGCHPSGGFAVIDAEVARADDFRRTR